MGEQLQQLKDMMDRAKNMQLVGRNNFTSKYLRDSKSIDHRIADVKTPTYNGGVKYSESEKGRNVSPSALGEGFYSKEKFVKVGEDRLYSKSKEKDIVSVVVDSIVDVAKIIPRCLCKAFDCYGNVIYRIVEGKVYTDDIIDNTEVSDEFVLDDIVGRYDFHPIEEYKQFKLHGKIGYVAVEGEKEGLKACVGIDTEGEKYFLDILRGHLIIGACSEWGKSNLINVYLTNLIRTYTTNEFRYMLCDFKMLDLKMFERYGHCIGNCTTDKQGFLEQLKWLDKECNRRATILDSKGYLNVKDYNEDSEEKFTFIVFVIDELPAVADDSKCLEELIKMMRKSRAYGVYFLLASQDVRKKTIDAVRMLVSQVVGLHVATKTDSDTLILEADLHKIDTKGRFKIEVGGEIKEVQSYYIHSKEVREVLKYHEKQMDK